MKQALRIATVPASRMAAWAIGACCAWICCHTFAQVPEQDRQPAGVALRPAVMGPSGAVSTGHPLTTAVALGT